MGISLNQQLTSIHHAEHGFKVFASLTRIDIQVSVLSGSHSFLLDKKPGKFYNAASLLSKHEQHKIPYDALEYDRIWEAANPDSLINLIKEARTHANLVRDILCESIWQHINQLYAWVKKKSTINMFTYERTLFYHHIQSVYFAILGTYYHTSLSDKFYYFMEMGLLYERLQHTYRVIDKVIHDVNEISFRKANPNEQTIYYLLMLKFCNIDESYFRLTTTLNAQQIIHILLYERRLHCSFWHCIKALNLSLVQIGEKHQIAALFSGHDKFSLDDYLAISQSSMREVNQIIATVCPRFANKEQ